MLMSQMLLKTRLLLKRHQLSYNSSLRLIILQEVLSKTTTAVLEGNAAEYFEWFTRGYSHVTPISSIFGLSVYPKTDNFEEKYFSVFLDRSNIFFKKIALLKNDWNKVISEKPFLYQLPRIDSGHQVVTQLWDKVKVTWLVRKMFAVMRYIKIFHKFHMRSCACSLIFFV